MINPVPPNKTYTDLYAEDNNKVVFGNPDVDSEFQSHVKMEFWGENHISLHEEGVGGVSVLVGEKITLDLPSRKLEWFKSDSYDGKRDTDIHWVVTLKEKPASNVWSLRISDGNEFEYRYQAPYAELVEPGDRIEYLTIDGVEFIRRVQPNGRYVQHPLNAEGSYAVYHNTKRDHIAGQKNYKAGKVLHSYRPKATDADGKFVWCDIEIKNGIYTRTIPQDFLDNAVYPVIINDTFGHTDKGANGFTMYNDYIEAAGPFSPASNGTVTQISIYTAGTTRPITLGIWADSSGNPGNILADSAEGSSHTDGWTTLNVSQVVVGGVDYWLGKNQDDDTTLGYYDADASYKFPYESQAYVSGTLGNFSSPTGGTSRKGSAYATYTPTGGVTYQELNLTVTAAGTVSGVDVHKMVEPNKIVSAAGSVTGTDVWACVETGLTVSAVGAVSGADGLQYIETGLVVTAAGTVTGSDAVTCRDLLLTVSGAGVVTGTDSIAGAYQELNLTVVAAGVVSGVDTQDMVESNKTVTAAGVVSGAAVMPYSELGLAVVAAASVIGTDVTTYTEAVTVSAAGVVSGVDVHNMVELNKIVTTAGVVSGTDAMVGVFTAAAFVVLRQVTS